MGKIHLPLSQFTVLHTLSFRSKGIMFGAASRTEPLKCARSGLGAVAWPGSISCHRIYGEGLPMDVFPKDHPKQIKSRTCEECRAIHPRPTLTQKEK